MIWISTLYFNEDLMLKLRRAEELSVVDRFSVVEGSQSFSGNRKQQFLPAELRDGILYDRLELRGEDAWKREAFQRNAFWRLYEKEITDDDVVMVADLDEIPNRVDYPAIQAAALQHGIVRISQRTHYYKLNLICEAPWAWLNTPFVATKRYIAERGGDLHKIRNDMRADQLTIKSGHHFSYLLTPEGISIKLDSFSHTEYACSPYHDVPYISACIDKRKQLFDMAASDWYPEPIDETYPVTIRENLAAWQDWIVDA